MILIRIGMNTMIDGFLTKTLGKKIDVYARNNYANWCNPKGEGAIPARYRMAGACVFIHSSSYGHITHVGYLYRPVDEDKPDGDWYVIEARGVMYGVVKTKLSERGWNRWGLPTKYLAYDGLEPAKEYEFGERPLQKGDMGNDVRALQSALIELGISCGSYGADGEFCSATQSAVLMFQQRNDLPTDGIFSEDDFAALDAIQHDDPDPESTDALVVTGGSVYLWDNFPDYGGDKCEIVHKGDVLEAVTSAYIPVIHDGKLRFINSKYTDRG